MGGEVCCTRGIRLVCVVRHLTRNLRDRAHRVVTPYGGFEVTPIRESTISQND